MDREHVTRRPGAGIRDAGGQRRARLLSLFDAGWTHQKASGRRYPYAPTEFSLATVSHRGRDGAASLSARCEDRYRCARSSDAGDFVRGGPASFRDVLVEDEGHRYRPGPLNLSWEGKQTTPPSDR